MREKVGLLESKTNFGQQRKNWVEPLRSFVLSLKQAADLEKTSNHLEWKKFFQKIGSNPEIKDKTVSIRWGELWDFTASAVGERVLAKIKARFWLPQNRSIFLIPNKLLLVRGRGLEPPYPYGHIHLKDTCLPFHHPRVFLSSFKASVIFTLFLPKQITALL